MIIPDMLFVETLTSFSVQRHLKFALVDVVLLGVVANPPSAVSLKILGICRPTWYIAWTTSSGGITLSIPAKAISAEIKCL